MATPNYDLLDGVSVLCCGEVLLWAYRGVRCPKCFARYDRHGVEVIDVVSQEIGIGYQNPDAALDSADDFMGDDL